MRERQQLLALPGLINKTLVHDKEDRLTIDGRVVLHRNPRSDGGASSTTDNKNNRGTSGCDTVVLQPQHETFLPAFIRLYNCT